MGPGADPDSLLLVLDSGPILEGANVVPSRCVTTPEVAAEIQEGGATGRRFGSLAAGGLGVRAASPEAARKVREKAAEAGSQGRLSAADVSILALALDVGSAGVLVSDDYTVLDVAGRLGLAARPFSKAGIESGREWRSRCVGCRREFPSGMAGRACPVCGSEVRLRVRRG